MTEPIFAADLFCGAGGTSTGLLQAARRLKKQVSLVAVNHWDLAIATHSANHPGVAHYNSDLRDVDPRVVVPAGKLRLLVASPECTHFSKARGGRPMSKQSRASVKYVLKWINTLDVEDVLIENVPDFMTWGPLHRICTCGAGKNDKVKHAKGCKYGTPIASRKGQFFQAFIAKLKSLGYSVSHRVLNSADYGDPQTRQRLFIVARKSRQIRWPEPTHLKNGGDMFGAKPRWRSAREIIDWSIKGESIYTRKKPLSENTMRRIWEGMAKYGGRAFVIGQQSGAAPRSVDDPLPTVATGGGIAFVQPFLLTTNWTATNRSQPRSLDEPAPTITGTGSVALVQPFIIQMDMGGRLQSLSEPMNTLTSADAYALVDPYLIEYNGRGLSSSVDEPIGTVTGSDRFGLVQPIVFVRNGKRYILDILFRMLQPHELAAAMSFPKSYKFTGNREKVVKQIGNSVPVGVAEALCGSLLQ